MTRRDAIARIIDRDAFSLPPGAVEGPGWELRRGHALKKALLIMALHVPTHQHVKRGSFYEYLGEAEMQIAVGETYFTQQDNDPRFTNNRRSISEGDKLTIYRAEDGRLWARFPDEFNDGRFHEVK
jgi:hypothetical protein